MQKPGIYLLLVLLAAVVAPARGNAADSLLFPADYRTVSALEVSLQLPMQRIIREKKGAGVKHDSLLTTTDGNSLALTVSRRGKSRQEHCRFPPLWLDFKKKTTKGTVFAGQNRLKLVTHCKKGYETKGYLAAEMLAYQLLNLFTEHSFRTRAVRVTYVDNNRQTSQQHWGFLIEHKSALAERLSGSAARLAKVDRAQLAPEYSALVAMHQFLIGNTDFSFIRGPEGDGCCHNVVPIQTADTVYPVPYDFDASGLVNPPYATPVPSLGIKRVTQRLYRGYCQHNNALDEMIRTFNTNRQAIYEQIDTFNFVPHLQRHKVKKYVDRFYAVLTDDKSVSKKIVGKCR